MVRKWFVGKIGVMMERAVNWKVRIESSGWRDAVSAKIRPTLTSTTCFALAATLAF